jgi:AcrR family transcriptional regulator
MGDAREIILGAATKLFAERGRCGTALEGVADAAGVTAGEITSLFRSEDDLYEKVLAAQFDAYATRMSAVFEGDGKPTEIIELMSNAMVELHRKMPYLFPLLYQELLNPSRHFDTIVRKNIQRVAYLLDNNFAKRIRKGTFKHGISPASGTMIMAGMFHYYFLASRLAVSLLPEPEKDEEYLSQALKIFLTGMLA